MIEAGDNEHKHEDNKINKKEKNRINYKEKINTTTKGNDKKKSAGTRTKGMSNKDKKKNTRAEIVKPKIFNLSSKTLSRYQTNILLRDLKFTPTPKHENIGLKSNIQNYTCRLRLCEFFQNKEANDSEENLFSKIIYLYPTSKRIEI